jgi:GNAT superfamily N-acetyltransferase
MKIREFEGTENDYLAMVAVDRAVWPDQLITLAATKHRDESRDKAYFLHRVMVEVEGQVVAVASAMEPHWSYRPGKYNLDISVLPAFEGRGIGSDVYEYLTRLLFDRSPAPILFTAGSRDDKPQGVRFLEKRGYTQTMRWPQSMIDLSTFDPGPFQAKADAVAASGIEIASLAELSERDPDWQRKVYDLDWAGIQDEPQPDTPTQMPFERYVTTILEAPEFMPQGFFIAVDNGEYVGLSELTHNPDGNEILYTGFTCVLRSHRRRGVATALKLRALTYAQSLGTRTVKTGNEENNPMYQINLRLGFEPAPAWLAYEKAI